jgi:UDP-N-acetylmuramoylalanine--D-glutamate ligase
MTLHGKTVVILGAGRSGRAAAALALREGATVSVYDEASSISGFTAEVALHPDATTFIGESVVSDLLIVSPGIDTYGPLVGSLSRHAGKVVGEMEFAWGYFAGVTIAITGTNGKTTTTEIISAILNSSGISCVPCGNYGTPLAEVVLAQNVPDVISLEASSFQLETIDRFKPQVALWLNFAPDHMDRYASVEIYRQAKLRIFENQDSSCTAVVRKGSGLPALAARVVEFSTEDASAEWFSNGIIVCHHGIEVLHMENETCLRGLHNAENIMAALAACEALARPLQYKAAFKSYVPPPHRCELVRILDGVEYLNDSKATNLHALESALRSQTRPVVLIAGGKEKGLDYSPVVPLLQQKALAAVTFGQIARSLGEVLSKGVSTTVAGTLEEALDAARKLAPRGSTILFSPGTSSFDMFTGYEHRGDTFRKLINELL